MKKAPRLWLLRQEHLGAPEGPWAEKARVLELTEGPKGLPGSLQLRSDEQSLAEVA